MNVPEKPIVFISHKHMDQKLARVISEFIAEETRNEVAIHNSSSPSFLGPASGERLTHALRKVLWDTDVLLLLYTSFDFDWSFCMWEAGVANDSRSPDTRMIVLQCGDDTPPVFAGDLTVRLRDQGSVQSFVKEFFLKPDFFPSLGRALAPQWTVDGATRAADRLFEKLKDAFPEPASRYTPLWPTLRLSLPSELFVQVQASAPADTAMLTAISAAVKVMDGGDRAGTLFGAGSPAGWSLQHLCKTWREQSAIGDAQWHESCCRQIQAAVRGEAPVVLQTTLVDPATQTEYVPTLARWRKAGPATPTEFEFFFVDVSNPRAIPVTSRMMSRDEIFGYDLEAKPPQSQPLLPLVKQLGESGYNRLPLFDAQDHARFVVHTSAMNDYVVQNLARAADLTLADLLQDTKSHKLVAAIAFVPPKATMADALRQMSSIDRCEDVFVTADGSKESPVLGWITNADFRRRNAGALGAATGR